MAWLGSSVLGQLQAQCQVWVMYTWNGIAFEGLKIDLFTSLLSLELANLIALQPKAIEIAI